MKEPKIRKIVTNLEEVFYEGGAEKPVETNSGRTSWRSFWLTPAVRMLSSTALAVSADCRSPKPSARTACTNSSPRLTIAPLATRGLFSRA